MIQPASEVADTSVVTLRIRALALSLCVLAVVCAVLFANQHSRPSPPQVSGTGSTDFIARGLASAVHPPKGAVKAACHVDHLVACWSVRSPFETVDSQLTADLARLTGSTPTSDCQPPLVPGGFYCTLDAAVGSHRVEVTIDSALDNGRGSSARPTGVQMVVVTTP